MIDFEKGGYQAPAYGEAERSVSDVFQHVYGWMCAGLCLSGVVAWQAFSHGLCQKLFAGPGMAICIIAEMVLVIALSAAINKISAAVAGTLFIAYAALNGLTLSVVFVAYKLELVQRVFFLTAGMFGGFALYGTFSKCDFSRIGSICLMGVLGLLLASLVNLFMRSSLLDWITSVVGVVLFSGLTMYDAKMVRALAENSGRLDDQTVRKAGVIGALNLYLDFVNMFLYILRLMGRRK